MPTRISFVAVLNILVSQVSVSGKGAARNIPKHLKGMRENVKAFILPEKESTDDTIVQCFMLHLNIRSVLSHVRLK